MEERIQTLKNEAVEKIDEAQTLSSLEMVEKEYLGKSGALQEILKGLKDMTVEEKKVVGPLVNTAKQELLAHVEEKKQLLAEKAIEEQVANEWLDVTLPGRRQAQFDQEGAQNPFSAFTHKAVEIFERLGFAVWEGDHIVHDYENFQALNFTHDHPARDMQDTFYLDEDVVLRTHTSSMQNKILSRKNYPIRAVVPGRCFRNEATDATHEVIFSQIEGVVVDEHISVSHLIGTLRLFLQEVFGPQVKTRIRPGYFPFVEPGLELEVDAASLYGESYDGDAKWVEVMPCGMIHPNVLREAGIDSSKYAGFAFGFGLTRLAMLDYGIKDARLLFAHDAKFLRQFLQFA